MKNLVYFSLVVLLVGVGGCKKEKKDVCAGVYCLHGHCVDGVCVCDSGYTGVQCLTKVIIDSCAGINCGAHGHCVNGVCNCDANWTGANCNQQIAPIDSLEGYYHMVGYSQFTGDTQVLYNEYVTISKVDDVTLSIFSKNLSYTLYLLDSVDYHYDSNNPSNFGKLTFHKPFIDDSVFYFGYYGGLAAGTSTYLHGIKIH